MVREPSLYGYRVFQFVGTCFMDPCMFRYHCISLCLWRVWSLLLSSILCTWFKLGLLIVPFKYATLLIFFVSNRERYVKIPYYDFLSVSSYNSDSFCFTWSEAQLLGTYKFRIVVFSWWVTYWLLKWFLLNSSCIFDLSVFFVISQLSFC